METGLRFGQKIKKDSRLFLDKVKELDKTEDCILDWSQVNVT